MRRGAGGDQKSRLEHAQVGVICLTRENLNNRWLLFEAGALAKANDGMVATFLLDVRIKDVKAPLDQFNHTTGAKEDVRRLVHTLNGRANASGERALSDSALDVLFEVLWPRLEAKLKQIASTPFVDDGRFYVLRFEKGGPHPLMLVNEVMKYFKVAGIFIEMWTVVDETPSVRKVGIKTKALLRSIVMTLKNAEVAATVTKTDYTFMRRFMSQSEHPAAPATPPASDPPVR